MYWHVLSWHMSTSEDLLNQKLIFQVWSLYVQKRISGMNIEEGMRSLQKRRKGLA